MQKYGYKIIQFKFENDNHFFVEETKKPNRIKLHGDDICKNQVFDYVVNYLTDEINKFLAEPIKKYEPVEHITKDVVDLSSIRNEYSLITSSGEVSLKYKKSVDDDDNTIYVVDCGYIIGNDAWEYVSRDDNGEISIEGSSLNMKISSNVYADDNLFTGDIIFERGDSDTTLTFRGVSENNVSEKPGTKTPTATRWLDNKKQKVVEILYILM